MGRIPYEIGLSLGSILTDRIPLLVSLNHTWPLKGIALISGAVVSTLLTLVAVPLLFHELHAGQ